MGSVVESIVEEGREEVPVDPSLIPQINYDNARTTSRNLTKCPSGAISMTKTLHAHKRKEEMDRIKKENLIIAAKIFKTKPTVRI